MSGTTHRHLVTEEEAGTRIDRLCAQLHPEHSRSRLSKLIRQRRVLLDGEATRPSALVAAGQSVEVVIPPTTETRVGPEPIPLQIVHEDEQLLVIDKPAGLIVHPGAGVSRGTLVSALLHHDASLAGVGGTGRAGLVHRLDRGTSGLLVVARTDAVHRALSAQFHDRTVEKLYHAIVWGRPRESKGEIDLPVGRDPRHRARMSTRSRRGRGARSAYRVLQEIPGYALVEVQIMTGRTHQIRVHMTALGYPLVGDLMYAGDRSRGVIDPERRGVIRRFGRPALHAVRLAFTHPVSDARLRFDAPWPADLATLWTGLGGAVP